MRDMISRLLVLFWQNASVLLVFIKPLLPSHLCDTSLTEGGKVRKGSSPDNVLAFCRFAPSPIGGASPEGKPLPQERWRKIPNFFGAVWVKAIDIKLFVVV